MKAKLLSFLVACGALAGLWVSDLALAQKSGGVLRMPLGTSIASMSIHEESTIVVLGPMMGVFNNLVMFDQHVPQNTLSSIVPDLASSWSWSEDGKELTFKLRDGVKWHDGKPFTAADVKCTWDLITDKSTEKLRVNPRKSWYRNLEEVIPNSDNEVTFRLKRPQTSFIGGLDGRAVYVVGQKSAPLRPSLASLGSAGERAGRSLAIQRDPRGSESALREPCHPAPG